MSEPATYRSRHADPGNRYEHVEEAGTDARGRVLLKCLVRQPLSCAPDEMRVDPEAPGFFLVKEAVE